MSAHLPNSARPYSSLYEHPVAAKRSSTLFSAFPYPTKIDPEAIALYIAAHTGPGQTVLDGFAGSGTTGVAALLCERPTEAMIAAAAFHGIRPEWGPRNAVLYELSTLGAFIGRMLTSPPDPDRFAAAAAAVLADVEAELGWMYEARAPDGTDGHVRHIVWSESLRCPACLRTVTLWDAAVTLAPAKIAAEFVCPTCHYEGAIADLPRVTASAWDDLLGVEQTGRVRQPVRIYGRTGTKTWSRPVARSDQLQLEKIASTPLPASVPIIPMEWGDLYRSGYHLGISHLHHFYTRRNLIVFARLWEAAGRANPSLVDALRFWLLGYNASHATLMTRVVVKRNMPDLVVTSGQPGVLYFSGLPVEKNLLAGLRRRASVVKEAFRQTFGCDGRVSVVNGSSRKLHIRDASIDYVFTDPPFGANIPYAEVNFINEAWLGSVTNSAEEVVVSRHQGKNIEDYRLLMTDVLSEFYRVLKPMGFGTVIFHSATASVWNALKSAYEGAGFAVERASILDKLQGSFKQVTTAGSVKGDPALLLRKDIGFADETPVSDWRLISMDWLAQLSDKAEASPQRMYSRLIGHYLAAHQEVPVSADAFYNWIRGQVETDGIFIPAE